MSFISTTNTTMVPTNVVSLYSTHKTKNSIKNLLERYSFKEYPNQLTPILYKSLGEYAADKSENQNDSERLKIIIESDHQEDQSIANPNPSVFQHESYFKDLKTELFGRDLMLGGLLSSTQTLTLKYLELTQEQGSVMVADNQTASRGRGTNKWESVVGGLLYTFKAKLSNGKLLPFLQYICGVAMIKAIYSLDKVKKSNIPSDLVRLKWPNDIYANDLKIGGILCQSNFFNSTFDVVIGIGLNLSNQKPTTSLNQLLNTIDTENAVTREELLASFFNEFEKIYIRFLREGFKPFESDYQSYWLHKDQVVLLKEENKFIKLIGLTDEGYLKAVEVDKDGVITDPSKIHSLYPDGNSFDFQNSIILPKK